MKILVTGGAGYIGSFMTKVLLDRGDEVVVVDSLERGYKDALDTRSTFIEGNLLDKAFVASLFSSHTFDGVIHFAAYIAVGESMQKPYEYFTNNIAAGLNILEEMHKTGQNNFIFSSTAAVYGTPQTSPIPEDHPKNPENPYGESKLMVERILHWYHKVHGISYTVLRYFNACGAALDGSQGERHAPETHIIPSIMKAILENKSFQLFGDDYKTNDGTCVRDYIHVLDLAQAHILALEKLQKDQGEYTFNVGTGKGYSNKEIVTAVEKVSGKSVAIQVSPRRPGDANELVADATNIREELGFNPQYSDLETIVGTAWKWHSTHSA